MIKILLDIIAKRNVYRDDIESNRQYVMVVLFFCLGMTILFIMGIIALIKGDVLLGLLDFSMAVFLGLVIILMWEKRNHQKYTSLVVIVVGLYYFYLFIMGGANEAMHVWAYTLPVVASFTTNYKRSFIFSYALLVLMIASQMIKYSFNISYIYQYPAIFQIRFYATYAVIALISCTAEWLRQKSHEKMIVFQHEMKQTILVLEETRAKLRNMTNIDPLTKIYNKRYMTHAMGKMLKNSKSKYIASMFFDIDDFKQYNDYYGHVMGDKVLIDVVETIQSRVAEYNGTFVRFGGEELVYILKTNDLGSAEEIAEQVICDLNVKRIPHKMARTGYVTVSIGIAYCSIESCNGWEPIVMKSDEAMYQAKKNGKNSFYRYN